jgi:hypothetical protein
VPGPTKSPGLERAPGDIGGTVVFTTKFSDLVGYLQLLNNRITMTLAVIALTVTASGAMAPLWPFRRLPPGSLPIPAAVAAIALTISVVRAVLVTSTPVELLRPLFKRLEANNLPSVDHVDAALHEAFVRELKRKQLALRRANQGLQLGVCLVVSYFYLTVVIACVIEIPLFRSPSSLNYFGLRSIALYFNVPTAAIAVTALNFASTVAIVWFWWRVSRQTRSAWIFAEWA